MKLRNTAALVLLASISACKQIDEPVPDMDAGLGRTSMCQVDDQNKPEKALAIQLDMPVTNVFICPATDIDWYTFTLPPSDALLTVNLAFPSAATSAVELSYEIYAAADLTSPVATGQDTISTDNRSSLTRRHYLGPQGGTYLIVVRDAGGEDQDDRNPYTLTLTAEPDPDPSEPNNDCAHAKPLTTPTMGAIGYNGDHDAFKIAVPPGSQIVDVTLTYASATTVDLSASLYMPDGTSYLTDETDLRGDDGPTSLRLRYGVLSTGGDFCLIVKDDDDIEADPALLYTITQMVVPEPDQNEQTKRNDVSPDALTVPAGGGMYTGFIASKGDLDWYKVVAPPGKIVEVELDCPGCGFQPTISYVYSHTVTGCDPGAACDYLIAMDSPPCQIDADCGSGICRQFSGQNRRCAMGCESDLECPSFQCQQTGGVSACVGAATCTSEARCGVLQFTKTAEQDHVKTAQPMLQNTTWILVRDFQDDQFATVPYTLNINVADDPDMNEPNNFYEPYLNFNGGDVLDHGRRMAARVQWTAIGGGRYQATGRGCIAYENDIDLFRIEGGNPCLIARTPDGGVVQQPDAAAPADALPAGMDADPDGGVGAADATDPDATDPDAAELDTLGVTGGGQGGANAPHCGLQMTYSRIPAGERSDVDLAYVLADNGLGARASFLASMEGTETVFGDATCGGADEECMFYWGGDNGDYYVYVRDYMSNDWDLDRNHCYTWTLTSAPTVGCPASCPMIGGNGLCDCP